MSGIELSEEEVIFYLRSSLQSVRAERNRLMEELAEQKRLNLKLADRLAKCSEVLGRAAEKRACGCQQQPRVEGGEG